MFQCWPTFIEPNLFSDYLSHVSLSIMYLFSWIVNLWYSNTAQFHMDSSDHLLRQIYTVAFESQVKRSEVSDTLCHSAASVKTELVNLGKRRDTCGHIVHKNQ